MAFPSVAGTPAESSTNTAGTSHVVTLPGSIQAGETLLIFLDKGSTAATINAVAGWTELVDENSGNGIYIAWRKADGTEGSSVTLTSSASTRTARIAYRVTGAADPTVLPPTLGTVGTGTSTGPNAGNCNPAAGTKDYLWFTMFGCAGEEADDDTWCNNAPTNYGNLLQKACGTAGTNLGGIIAVAYRQANGSSEDAGAFNQDASLAWRAYTVAVHPAFPALTLDTGSLAETGVDATLAAGRIVTASPGSVALTGADASLGRAISFTAEPGALSMTGVQTDIVAGRMIQAATEAILLGGVDATFEIVTPEVFISADPGALSVTGLDAGLIGGRALVLAASDYVMTGIDITATTARMLDLMPAVVNLTGADALIGVQEEAPGNVPVVVTRCYVTMRYVG